MPACGSEGTGGADKETVPARFSPSKLFWIGAAIDCTGLASTVMLPNRQQQGMQKKLEMIPTTVNPAQAENIPKLRHQTSANRGIKTKG